MDFANLDLKSASEIGAWVHLTKDGQELYEAGGVITTDESESPCRIKIRGVASKGVLDNIRAIERTEMAFNARLTRAKDREIDGLVAVKQTALTTIICDLIAAAVAEWENIIWDGEDIDCTRENVLKICGPETYFFMQVYGEIMERHRLFKDAASG